eukprot:6561869-Pyramimonas_sp.AAC.1
MSANVLGGCKGPDLREASRAQSWSDPGHQHYKKGAHAPVRFVLWSFNDIADQATHHVLGVRVEGERSENPTILAGALRLLLETSDRIIDDAAKCSPDGAIEILFIGGDHRCWQSPDSGFDVDPMWDDVAAL